MRIEDLRSENLTDLVAQARLGDREAFGELVRRHRTQMLTWARRITGDAETAEDIVQDALLQTLQKLSTLKEPDKFIPWLRTIVRNRALMELRSSARARLSGWTGWTTDDRIDSPEQTMHLAQQEVERRAHLIDPADAALKRQALAQFERLFERLGERERAVLLAHGFAELPIPEVAVLLGMKSGAVYTALSRARRKLTDANFQAEVSQYVAGRRQRGLQRSGMVSGARYHWFAGARNTMAATILETLLATGVRNVSLADVMGLSGQAFSLYATPGIGLSSAYAFDWANASRFGWGNLGYSAAIFGGAGLALQRPDDLVGAMEQMQDSIVRGTPIIAWNVSSAEFGLICGFDDETGEWMVTDTTVSGKRLPYAKLGRSQPGAEWFVVIPGTRYPVSWRDSLHRVLTQAVRHIRGHEQAVLPDCAAGLNAYATWIEAFRESRTAEPLSIAYHASYTAEARRNAARFLQARLADGTIRHVCKETEPAVHHARVSYTIVAEAWTALSHLFPLPFGGNPLGPGLAERAVRLLERAAAEERQAADALEEAADWLERR
ncbi:RNA polymerase sigma factor [Paenibacillus apiarius]|uniref:RNA polymerase sigma factor n=1 Tax=Paenibacillus apiarius TaxID=46240 RepID=A0ABT4DTE3_9BACL|nr:sigma-70 family RNA polymerase sigma factor [Paenibacillus apiarius]MCY9515316.1 sigma-70 family RNA polymerase sigma factor [Paenibacillus apiarius]MCY9520065.1 sigma-70 family RNA polymerase sigma factor [Paenibacillus apiarius]MCY9554312.1 sigma-70 family RNA polymerase sigma factor [Paenibacillus apiarius]MCY9558103.1 sigma-70 family RNA polymerase sigma factor [Paenibacillus apiarius]MCY9684898.1 sigma-70 family RNA polymerase sigma factor [Paenibacillus apiarius]